MAGIMGRPYDNRIQHAVVVGGRAAVQILLLEDAAQRLAVERVIGPVVVALRAVRLVDVVAAHLLRVQFGERRGRRQLGASYRGG